MKKVVGIFFVVFLYIHTVSAFMHYPCTVIIENSTQKSLNICLEYRLDQMYINNEHTELPYVPNNKRYHFLNELAPGSKAVVPILAFTPCAEQFCYLDAKLKSIGFLQVHKRIEGSITLQNQNFSYSFTHSIKEGKTLTLQIEEYGLNALFT